MGKIAITERVTGHTELIGLIAYPIRHSMSPTMHNEAFKKLGLDYVYVCFEVDNSTLEDTVKGLRAMKVRGHADAQGPRLERLHAEQRAYYSVFGQTLPRFSNRRCLQHGR